MRRNSNRVKISRRESLSGVARFSSAGSSPSSTSCRMVASSRDRDNCSRLSRRLSPTFPLMASAFSTMPSAVPYSLSHLAAVLAPTFGTPGMLSDESPTSASQSMICSGNTSNFSLTPSRSSTAPVIVLTIVTRSLTSCAMSLSPVDIRTSIPAAAACRLSVPITSSASTPSIRKRGRPIAGIVSSRG